MVKRGLLPAFEFDLRNSTASSPYQMEFCEAKFLSKMRAKRAYEPKFCEAKFLSKMRAKRAFCLSIILISPKTTFPQKMTGFSRPNCLPVILSLRGKCMGR